MDSRWMMAIKKRYYKDDSAKYQNCCVAFIDILGFRSLVAQIESKDDLIFKRLYRILMAIKEIYKPYDTSGETSIKASCFSDCIVLSAPASLRFSVVQQAMQIYQSLLFSGILSRGAITIGSLCHQNDIVFGSGLISAYEQESSLAVYPRILVPSSFLNERPDFSKFFIKNDDNLSSLAPFPLLEEDRLKAVIWMSREFNLIAEKKGSSFLIKYFKVIQSNIEEGLHNYSSNPKIYQKYDWLSKHFNKAVTLREIPIPLFS